MAQSDHDSDAQLLDSRDANTPKDTASAAPRNVQGEPPVSVPAALLERPADGPEECVTCGSACDVEQWFVPSGGWACCRECIP